MSEEKGKPSGINKSEGTGIPSKPASADINKNEQLDNELANDDKNLPRGKPNRNVDKDDATNKGGYQY
jgi:hypothetical protein